MSLLLTLGDTTPNPRTLFANNEQGLALDVEAAYLRGWIFQDSAGATVAAAAGDPVGLILDTAKGGLDQLGSELVTNGTFTTNTTGWTATNSTLASVNGELEVTATSSSGMYAGQTVTTTSGKFYLLTASLRAPSANTGVNSARVYIYETDSLSSSILIGSSQAVASEDSTLTITRIFRATASTAFIQLGVGSSLAWGSSGDKAYFDNISVREIPGNHCFQTSSGSRPLLARTPDGGRRNVLTFSEQFDNAAWTKSNSTISANATPAPDGTTTADKLVENTATSGHAVRQIGIVPDSGASYTASVYLKASERGFAMLQFDCGGNNSYAIVNLSTGVFGSVTGTGATFATTSVGNGWWRCSATATTSSTASGGLQIYLASDATTFSYTGDGTSGVFIWGAQFEKSSSATAYQKVGLSSDVQESGKRDCWGLLFDGSDDSLATSSIDFSATDKMTVMAGVRKLSDAADGMVAELTTGASSSPSGNGGFYLLAPELPGPLSYASLGRGTASVNGNQRANRTSLTAPHTGVISSTHDISGDLTTLRVNAVAATDATGDKGSGNFANAAIFIGRRNNASLPFNGLIYTLIIRGASTPTATIADFEKNLLARRAGVVL